MISPTARHLRAYAAAVWALLALAVLWSIGLLVGAATIPVYGSETVSTINGGSTTTSTTSETMVEVLGPGALVLMAIPLAASLIVAIALLRTHNRWAARWVAWVLTGLVGLVSMLAVLTVGPVIFPAAVFLAAACALDLMRPRATRPSLTAQPS